MRSEVSIAKTKRFLEKMNCKICGTSFMPKSIKSAYCSDGCAYQAELSRRSKKPKTKKCSFCKKEFAPYTSLDKFCSANCRVNNVKSRRKRNWTSEQVSKRTGKNNPCYRNGLRCSDVSVDGTGIRLFHANRDEYKREFIEKNGCLWCEKCGDSNAKLEAHHIIYRSEKPAHAHLHSKQNILLVCVKCHNWFHKSKSNRNSLVEERRLHLLFGNDVLDK